MKLYYNIISDQSNKIIKDIFNSYIILKSDIINSNE